MSKKILAIIPARGGSKGVPRKNLRIFKQQTLLAHTINTAKASRHIDRVIVSSEDAEILAEAKRIDADTPFVRPAELAQDETPGIDPVLHAIGQLKSYDYVVLLQVTSPLRTTEDIDACIEYCIEKNAPACVSVTEVEQHPYWMFSLDETSKKLTRFYDGEPPGRRQALPAFCLPNGAIYVAKTDWLLRTKKFVTEETIGFMMPKERSLDIDSELDFLILEAYGK